MVNRVAFAFDPRRAAILLGAGNKLGANGRFDRHFIRTADTRFETHLHALQRRRGEVNMAKSWTTR